MSTPFTSEAISAASPAPSAPPRVAYRKCSMTWRLMADVGARSSDSRCFRRRSRITECMRARSKLARASLSCV